MPCAICEKRRSRRYCPAVRDEICPICCGAEREVTLRCPSDCEYLMDARKHERTVVPETRPYPDMRITSEFLADYAGLLSFLSFVIHDAANRVSAVDTDVREAVASLIKTYRTLESGLIYDDVPANPLAAAVYQAIREGIPRFMEDERKALGMTHTRDSDILRALMFVDILALERNNGRRYGRSFIDAISHLYGPELSAGGPAETPSLIVP